MTRASTRHLADLGGRSVFVTGHTGFKGAWLSLWLHRLGAQVTGYALQPPTQPNLFEQARIESTLVTHHVGDLRDRTALSRAMRQAQPDVVLHLAAQSVVRESYREPYETFDVNVMGTAAVLDAVRELDRPCAVVVVSSDKCYENREQVWGYRETDAMGGHDPYSASKGACELVVASYRRSFFDPAAVSKHGVKVATARAGNVIGGGDWTADALIPDLVRSLEAQQPLALRSPLAVRPWQHVLDALSGYLTLAAQLLTSDEPRWCDGWNFGPLPGGEVPVRELVGRLLESFGESPTSWIDVSDGAHHHEAHTLRLSVEKAMWELDWCPRWTVDEAVRYAADWYRAFSDGGDARELCMQDISDYENALAATSRRAVAADALGGEEGHGVHEIQRA